MLTVEEFLRDAKEIVIIIDGARFEASPKAFSTGSFGWGLTTKAPLPIGEGKLQCQIGLNMTVIGSKPK